MTALAAVGLTAAATLPREASAATALVINDSQVSVGSASLAYSGTWTTRTGTRQYGGDDRYAKAAGTSYTLRFTGTSAILHGSRTPNHGRASVTVDGRAVTTLDLYNSSALYDVPVFSTGALPYGAHTVTVTLTGTRQTASSGTYVTFDRALVDAGSTTAVTAPVSAPTTSSTATTAPAPTATATPAPPATGGKEYLIIDEAALKALPTSGTAWTNVLRVADGSLGVVDLQDQNNLTAGRTLAAALVYARTGSPGYRDKVVAQLAKLPSAPLGRARTLSVGRQIGGYAVAADLVGYRDPAFVSFMSGIRTRHIGNHGRWVTLSQTSENTANNWGTWAVASRLAVSLYVGDQADVARTASIFRGFLGDRSAYAGFQKTAGYDPTWACGTDSTWVPINPASCGDRAGAAVEDISRSAGSYPTVDATGLQYTWEALGGITLTAKLLQQNGYPDVYGWSDKAVLRATQFLQRKGGFPAPYSVTQHIAWSVNKAYGSSFPVSAAGHGRQYGFTDWLP